MGRWKILDLPDSGSFNPAYFAAITGGDRNYVWSESWLPAATGGGPSTIYTRPSWQGSVLPVAGDHRLVPDVAWNAAVNGGVLVYISAHPNYNGPAGFYVYGGTSAATPQLAALTALANERRASEGKPPIGKRKPGDLRIERNVVHRCHARERRRSRERRTHEQQRLGLQWGRQRCHPGSGSRLADHGRLRPDDRLGNLLGAKLRRGNCSKLEKTSNRTRVASARRATRRSRKLPATNRTWQPPSAHRRRR